MPGLGFRCISFEMRIHPASLEIHLIFIWIYVRAFIRLHYEIVQIAEY